MGRGFGALAKPTGKCKCDNPKWAGEAGGVDFVENNTKLRYTLKCCNCGKWWYTKSRSARQYFDPDRTITYGGRTYREIFAEGDRLEREYLERVVSSAQREVDEANKKLIAAQKAYDKFIAQLNGDSTEDDTE